MNLGEYFDATPERVLPLPLLHRSRTAEFSRGDDPPASGRTRKAAREVAPSQTAAVANESPARTTNDGHGNDNGASAPEVAVNLEQAREKGRELRAAVALEGDHPAEVWFNALLGLAPRVVVLTRANARGDVYAWLTIGDKTTLLVGKRDGEEAVARTAVAAVGLHLFGPAVGTWENPQECPSRAVSTSDQAWGNAFARAFLGMEAEGDSHE